MRRFLSAILAFMICNFTIFSYVYAENETNNTANNTAATDLQTQRNEIQNQMNEANEQLQGVQSDISENLQQGQKLDEKISKQNFEYEDILGDIVISIAKVEEQAKEYGHSFEREFAYMLVHGFYHLMGYDHIKEEDKAIMRPKEEKVLAKLGITREEMNEK